MTDITSKYNHITLWFYVVHFQGRSYVHRTVFLYYNLREVHSSAAPHMQLEIFWVTPHTAWSPSLLDLFSIFPSYNILSLSLSLSVNPCRLLEYKIQWANRLLDSQTLWCLAPEGLTIWMAQNSQNANLLQYKIHPFIGGLKVSPLQHYRPVPTVTQNPN